MADSKKTKQIKQKEIPKGKSIAQGGNPEQYYTEKPAWSFANSDQDMWSFTQEHIGELIWTEILPRLKALIPAWAILAQAAVLYHLGNIPEI